MVSLFSNSFMIIIVLFLGICIIIISLFEILSSVIQVLVFILLSLNYSFGIRVFIKSLFIKFMVFIIIRIIKFIEFIIRNIKSIIFIMCLCIIIYCSINNYSLNYNSSVRVFSINIVSLFISSIISLFISSIINSSIVSAFGSLSSCLFSSSNCFSISISILCFIRSLIMFNYLVSSLLSFINIVSSIINLVINSIRLYCYSYILSLSSINCFNIRVFSLSVRLSVVYYLSV